MRLRCESLRAHLCCGVSVQEFESTWLDNSKAKFHLGWRPEYDLPTLIDAAFDYERSEDDPRIVWYPG